MKHLLLCLLLLSACIVAQAQTAVRLKNFNTNKGLALDGYDPLTYFKGKPEKGSTTYSYTHDGIVYHFINAQNMAAFKKNPAAYEPQYGGWCAYAMGNTGEKVEVDPETFKIINGKLYLFYNHLFTNTLKTWNKSEAQLKPQADANWQKLYH